MVRTTTFTSLLTISGLLVASSGMTQTPAVPEETQPKEKAIVKSTVRVLTKGMFTYGGRIACENAAFDVNFVYERKGWGTQIFKVTDLVDHNSPNNFMMTTVYKNLKLGRKLTVTPHVAAILEQQQSFAGHDSDVALITVTALKLNKYFTIDHTMLLGNLFLNPSSRDWINRMRLMFTSRHVDVTGILWHNNPVFDHQDYTSMAVSLGYNRLKVSSHINLNFSATALGMIESSNEEFYPRKNKLVLSTAIQYVR